MGETVYLTEASELKNFILQHDVNVIKVYNDKDSYKEFVRVIKCKDCKYYIEHGINCFAEEQGYCGYTWKEHGGEWFCARGTKEGEAREGVD